MTIMKKSTYLLVVFLGIATAAGAQQEVPTSDETYAFITAKLAAEDGRFDEALPILDKLVSAHPDNVTLVYERAMVRVDAGQPEHAEADLRKVVEANPKFFDAQRVLGRMLLDRAGNDRAKLDEARQHLEAAFRLNTDDLVSGIAVSQIYNATNRPAEAERVLAQLLERAPDQRTLNYNYALVLSKLGKDEEARGYLERAVQLDPTFGPAILQLVDVYQKQNEWLKAADILTPLLKEDPANTDLQRRQAFFYLRGGDAEKARATFKQLSEADPKDTRSQFYLAEALNDLERHEEADTIYRKLLTATPDDADVLASLGLSQTGQRKYDDAEKTFKSLLALNDVSESLKTIARTQLAYIDLQKGRYADAVEHAKGVLTFHDRPNPQAINIAVDALKRQKRYADAVVLLQPLATAYPNETFVISRYIEMLMRAGDREAAQKLAAAQMKLGSKSSVAVAEAYLQNDEYAPAISMLRDALKVTPEDVDLQYELGSAIERSGDRAAAEKIFLDLLQKHPNHAATLNYLGYMWAESGVNLDRAAEMLNKAVSQEPRNGAYIDSLGWVYYRQGKLDLAEKYLTDATRLLPRDATVREHLGDVFAKRGDYHRALDLYRIALTLEPEPKDEAKLKSKIAEVEKQTR